MAFWRQPHAYCKVLSAGFSDSGKDLMQKTGAIFRGATIFIIAVIELWAQKLADDKAMRGVEFNTVEPRPVAPNGGCNEIIPQGFDSLKAHRLGAGLTIKGGRLQRPVDQVAGRAAATVEQLDRRMTAMLVNAGGQSGQTFQMLIPENAQLTGPGFADLLNICRTGYGKTKIAFCPFHQPPVFVIRQRAVLVALLVGQRGQHKAVFHSFTLFKGNRLVKIAHVIRSTRFGNTLLTCVAPRWSILNQKHMV
ncbi:hypothetical protein [Phaeobacter sp. J2-8]|uniref:hypothetical protein n=1 Tax=Phaeobacter sp. J2-8 TaxID=2931394 RepID=UPI001FD3853E|nr:hypothetical protein [Phaeobacter sp. J2-8]MCJ7873846.1 hypothetical protein [Phaeobacter sp. J2-8]